MSCPGDSQCGLDAGAEEGGEPRLVSNLKEMHPRDEGRHFRFGSELVKVQSRSVLKKKDYKGRVGDESRTVFPRQARTSLVSKSPQSRPNRSFSPIDPRKAASFRQLALLGPANLPRRPDSTTSLGCRNDVIEISGSFGKRHTKWMQEPLRSGLVEKAWRLPQPATLRLQLSLGIFLGRIHASSVDVKMLGGRPVG